MMIVKRETREVPTVNPLETLDRLFDAPVGLFARRMSPFVGIQGAAIFNPPVDIIHAAEELVLRAELPGVRKEDIELTVHEDSLTLKGSKKVETESKEGQYQHVERQFGEFARTFQLPAVVDTAKVRAEFKEGILSVHMPIAEAAKPRKIDITVN